MLLYRSHANYALPKKMLNLSRIKGFLQGSSTLVKRSYILYCLFQELFKFSVYFGHLPATNPKRLYILYQYETIAVNKIIFFLDFFFVNYTYSICVSFFLLFLNQCACFTKKQAALVAEWVPKIWFSSTYLLEFERWNKPWNGLKATWTRFIFNFLYFSKFCMYVHTSNGTCNFEKSSIMIWNQ